MNKYSFIKIALVAITLGCLTLFTLSSCRTGYGCNGRGKYMTRVTDSSPWRQR